MFQLVIFVPVLAFSHLYISLFHTDISNSITLLFKANIFGRKSSFREYYKENHIRL